MTGTFGHPAIVVTLGLALFAGLGFVVAARLRGLGAAEGLTHEKVSFWSPWLRSGRKRRP